MFFPPYELDAAAPTTHSPPAPPPPHAPPQHGCRDFNFNPSIFMARRKLKRYRSKRVPPHGPGGGGGGAGAGAGAGVRGAAGAGSLPPPHPAALPPPLRT
ncbi:hypothetical protein AWZ03_004424 [Drosophila navojoa]|uniref:Uncharacterized protein n=1 Tax=Drosophila navojoa TaxID=7232 RepID=A0A484BKD5_DRONA|nr:hypothetical protein AWZ03_004424 [Drosophila navojoa]